MNRAGSVCRRRRRRRVAYLRNQVEVYEGIYGSERVPAGEKMEKDEKGSVADLISGRGAAFGCCHAHWKEQFENCKAAKMHKQKLRRQMEPDRGNPIMRKHWKPRLAQILEGMEGVGNVQVMITFQDQGESVVEKDVTMRQDAGTGSSGQNSSGGTTGSAGTSGGGKFGSRESSESTVFSQSDGDETPFVK